MKARFSGKFNEMSMEDAVKLIRGIIKPYTDLELARWEKESGMKSVIKSKYQNNMELIL